MKKALILSLAAVLTLSASPVVAQANPDAGTKNAESVSTFTTKAAAGEGMTVFKQMPAEITGVIQEINENEMKVKTQDGEVYLVPLGLFAKAEGFDGLGLAKDVNVTLKSIQPKLPDTISISIATGGALEIQGTGTVKLNPDKVITRKLEGIKTEKGNAVFTIKEGEVPVLNAKAVEFKELQKVFIAEEITANGKTVKIDVKAAQQIALNAAPVQAGEISGTVRSINEKDMTVETKDGKIYTVPLAKFNALQEFKALDIKEGTEVQLKSGAAAVKTLPGNQSITAVKLEDGTVTVKSVDGQNIKMIDIHELEPGKLIFIAGEITTSGKTVKLP